MKAKLLLLSLLFSPSMSFFLPFSRIIRFRERDDALRGGGGGGPSATEIGEQQPLLPSTTTNSNLVLKPKIDYLLLFYFALFYAGNYGYSLTNKLAIREASYPISISAMNFGVGALTYVPILWMTGVRSLPKLKLRDLQHVAPLALLTAGAHTAAVYSYTKGSVSFVQIVKAAEPVFCAVLSSCIYRKNVSLAKWLTLPVIIGGVVLASANEYNFSMIAFLSASLANLIAAIRSLETKRLLSSQDVQERIKGPGNQFALTALLGFAMLLPMAAIVEGAHWGRFWTTFQNSNALRNNLLFGSLYFYGYNELRTVTLKKTSAVTSSVANTLKRVIVIVGVAIVLGEHLTFFKLLGCFVGIFGVLLYSIADTLFPPPPAE